VTSIGTPLLWISFTVVVVAILGLDLLLMKRDPKPMKKRTALAWTSLWVGMATAFAIGIWWKIGREPALEFAAAYLIEYSLSVDNLFVFLLLFHAFKVPPALQHRVLFWGIFGAVILRAIFIFVGTALLQQFHFLIYVFGAFLVYTGGKLVLEKDSDEEAEVADNRIVRLVRRFIKVTDQYDGPKFFTLVEGARRATPLLVVLVSVELSDVVFALDSIPAVFGVTLDPFIVYTSNIFAILGLRALFFLLSGALWGLRFLKPCLGIVLAFVGGKMIASYWEVHVSIGVSLGVVGGLLATGVVLSVLFPGKKPDDVAAAQEVKEDVQDVLTGSDHPPPRPFTGE
jgi:tellurite resistance protein TerC